MKSLLCGVALTALATTPAFAGGFPAASLFGSVSGMIMQQQQLQAAQNIARMQMYGRMYAAPRVYAPSVNSNNGNSYCGTCGNRVTTQQQLQQQLNQTQVQEGQ